MGGTTSKVQNWRGFEDFDRFARDKNLPDLEPWRRFNRAVRDSGDVGIWHETFKVRAGEYEAVYGKCRSSVWLPSVATYPPSRRGTVPRPASGLRRRTSRPWRPTDGHLSALYARLSAAFSPGGEPRSSLGAAGPLPGASAATTLSGRAGSLRDGGTSPALCARTSGRGRRRPATPLRRSAGRVRGCAQRAGEGACPGRESEDGRGGQVVAEADGRRLGPQPGGPGSQGRGRGPVGRRRAAAAGAAAGHGGRRRGPSGVPPRARPGRARPRPGRGPGPGRGRARVGGCRHADPQHAAGGRGRRGGRRSAVVGVPGPHGRAALVSFRRRPGGGSGRREDSAARGGGRRAPRGQAPPSPGRGRGRAGGEARPEAGGRRPTRQAGGG